MNTNERFLYTKRSLYDLVKSMHHLKVILSEMPKEQMDYVHNNNYIFSHYIYLLNYIIVCEYCKLLETNTTTEGRNIASVYKIINNPENEKITPELKDELNTKLRAINGHVLSKTLRNWRNTIFAHSDGTSDPSKKILIPEKDLTELDNLVFKLYEIINQICELYEFTEGYYHSANKQNIRAMIKSMTMYKSFYFNNLELAHRQGFDFSWDK